MFDEIDNFFRRFITVSKFFAFLQFLYQTIMLHEHILITISIYQYYIDFDGQLCVNVLILFFFSISFGHITHDD